MDSQDPFSGVRLLIARLLADDRLTLYEISRALGRTPGSTSGVVHRMTREGILRADPDPPVRGTEFWLNPIYLDRLEADLADHHRPGTLVPHQRVLIIDATDRRAFYDIVARPALAGSVAWVADLDGAGGRLVALRDDADDLDVERLALAFQDHGIATRTGIVGAPRAGEDLRRFASSTRRQRAAR